MIFNRAARPNPQSSSTTGSSDSIETLHWLYSVEQRSVIPTKWLIFLLAFPIILIEDRTQLARWDILAVLVMLLWLIFVT